MIHKYFNKPETGEWLIDPIESKHVGLVEITEAEYSDGLELKNNPQKTYSQELAGLNADKEAKEDALAKKMSKVHMRNGVGEEPTVTAMRNAILTKIDSDYAEAKSALKLKYFGA